MGETRKRASVAATVLALGIVGCAHGEREVVRLQQGEKVDLSNLDLHRQSLIIERKRARSSLSKSS